MRDAGIAYTLGGIRSGEGNTIEASAVRVNLGVVHTNLLVLGVYLPGALTNMRAQCPVSSMAVFRVLAVDAGAGVATGLVRAGAVGNGAGLALWAAAANTTTAAG